MSDRTPQQIADQLNSLRAQAVSIVEGTIAGAANPGGSITFTYVNPIDHQPYTATGTAWNQCSPSKVSALKLEDGSWIVVGAHESAIVREAVHTDRRARPQPETGGKIKILYSQREGDEIVFYVWGDRPRPKEVGRIPLSSSVVIYQINNRGQGLNQFIVGLRWNDQFGVFSTKSLGESVWDYLNEPRDPGGYYRNDFYAGHGFWAFNSVSVSFLLASFISQQQPINYSVFEGIRKDGAASEAATGVNSDGYITSKTYTAVRDLAPNISRTEQGNVVIGNPAFGTTYYNPVIVSKDLQTAIYLLSGTTVPGPFTQNYQYKLARTGVAGDITLGGTLPPSFIPGNLVNDRLYAVAIPFASLTDKQWSVDVYQVGENTTKSTIKTKVTFRSSPGMNIWDASYHP